MSETCRVLINQVNQAASRWLLTYTLSPIIKNFFPFPPWTPLVLISDLLLFTRPRLSGPVFGKLRFCSSSYRITLLGISGQYVVLGFCKLLCLPRFAKIQVPSFPSFHADIPSRFSFCPFVHSDTGHIRFPFSWSNLIIVSTELSSDSAFCNYSFSFLQLSQQISLLSVTTSS